MEIKPIKSLGEKHSAFILSEALVGLLVTILTVFLLQGIIQICNAASNIDATDNIRLHIIEEQLQTKTSKFKLDKDHSNAEELVFIVNEPKTHTESLVKYVDKKGRMFLRMKNDRGGYQPILGNLINIQMSVKVKHVKIKLTDIHHQVSELYLANNEINQI